MSAIAVIVLIFLVLLLWRRVHALEEDNLLHKKNTLALVYILGLQGDVANHLDGRIVKLENTVGVVPQERTDDPIAETALDD